MDDNIGTMRWFTRRECGAQRNPSGTFIDFKLCTLYVKICISNWKGSMNGVQTNCKAAHKLSGCSCIWGDDIKLTRRHFLSTQYLVFSFHFFFHWSLRVYNSICVSVSVFMGVHTIELNRIESNNALKILQVYEISYSFIVLNAVVSANEALYICGIEFIIKIDLRIECVCVFENEKTV